MTKITENIEKILPKIIDIRQQLHEIPELKYEEFKTSRMIADVLRSFGYEVQEGIAKTGLTAILDTGKPGKTIGLRADMDALPLEEPESFAGRSRHPGRMHACGHDGHCAAVLAAAYVLSQIKNELTGKVKFIFQPAEEGGKGSAAMIAAGVLQNPAVDEIYGFHNWPGLPEGQAAVRAGTILAGNGRLEITLTGKPAHTAQPEKAINPVTIGALLVTRLQSLKLQSVLNVIAFNSGDFKRGMAEKAEIVGVYYMDSEDEIEQLRSKVNEISAETAQNSKAEVSVKFTNFHSATINSVSAAEKIFTAAAEISGQKNVVRLEKSMIASEDFSEYLKHVPGCFFLVGAGENAAPVHTSQFQFNDHVIAVAASVFCQLIVNANKIS